MRLLTILPAIAIAFSASLTNAAIVYTDATIANTTLATGDALTFSPGTEGDGLWNSRSFGNGVAVITSNESPEDAPRLRTTIGGLTVGQDYDVFAYFWGAGGGQLWRGRAGLVDVAGDLQGYNTNHFNGSSFLPMTAVTSPSNTGATVLNQSTLSTADGAGIENGGYFANSVLTEQADRRLYEVSLGTVTADGAGTISVFVDDLANTSNGNRTWYDGVGTQVTAIPEPTSVAFLALGSLGMISLRRRRKA